MARLAFFASALLGLGTFTEARQKAINEVHALNKDMSESLKKIAGRLLSKSDIKALVDLSSPKYEIIGEIDNLQKEIIQECHDETDTFNEWLQSKQNDLSTNNAQLDALQGHAHDIQTTIAQLQGELTGAEQDQEDLQQQLDGVQNDLKSYQQQLQKATDQRQKNHDQNEAIIQQHMDALTALQGLRNLIVNFDVNGTEGMTKQLAKVPKVNFLKRKHGSKINALIASVKTEIAKAMNKNPQDKAEIKQKLLDMIDHIMNGIQDSLNTYKAQENSLQQKFDNEVKPGLEQMISQTQDNIAAVQSKLSDVIADHGSIQSDLDQANNELSQTNSQIATLQGLIQALQGQIKQGTDSHNTKQSKCKADLDDMEEIRQYVVDHVEGMTPGINCNPESPTCPRCLYDAHCAEGQICTDDGVCDAAPTSAPPPQRQYSVLISDVVGPQTGRRLDVGVVPQQAFNNDDFTYVFKYQQLQASDNAWVNLFNVVNTGDGWPFPNQAGLFITGKTFEIDVCDDTKEWSDNYWYRNFYIDQVELNQWNAIAFIVSSSTKTVTMSHRDSNGNVKTQSYPDFHGHPKKFNETGIYVNGRGYASLNANFDDFRRYERALSGDEVNAVFNDFFH